MNRRTKISSTLGVILSTITLVTTTIALAGLGSSLIIKSAMALLGAPMATSGDNVYVSWWERNQTTANEPVMRVSNDNGENFGPVLHLASNGTISSGGVG